MVLNTGKKQGLNKIYSVNLTIFKRKCKNELSIYRQASHSPNRSLHSYQKHPFNGEIQTILSNKLKLENIITVLSSIKQIATNNGLKVDVVDNILKRHFNKKPYPTSICYLNRKTFLMNACRISVSLVKRSLVENNDVPKRSI